MRFLSINPESPADIEDHVQVFDERESDFSVMRGYLDSSAEPAVLGVFSTFDTFNKKYFALSKTIRTGDRRVSKDLWGEVSVTTSRDFARVDLPVATSFFSRVFDRSPFGEHTLTPRIVDMRNVSDSYRADERAFCVQAIAKGAYEHAAGLLQPVILFNADTKAVQETHEQRWSAIDAELGRLAANS